MYQLVNKNVSNAERVTDSIRTLSLPKLHSRLPAFYCILFLFLVVNNKHVIGQSLLLNGSFEDINVCTEYTAKCAPEAWVSTGNGVSVYVKDPAGAHSGQLYYAIQAGYHKRSYIRSQFLCGLRAGHRYDLQFFIRASDPILDSMGLYFTPYDFLYERFLARQITPSFYLAQFTHFNPGDTGWQAVTLRYTAKGDEGFMTIGNFSKNDVEAVRGSRMTQLFVYVDDVSFVPVDKSEVLCANWQQSRQDIYDQDQRHQFLDRMVKMKKGGEWPRPPLQPMRILQIDTLVLPDLLFESGKAVLQPASFSYLDSLCARVKHYAIDSVVVKGHTDNSGTTVINEKLSLDRAKATVDCLAPRISPQRIPFFIYGYADRMPVAGNDTPDGKRRNRRVEIFIYFKS